MKAIVVASVLACAALFLTAELHSYALPFMPFAHPAIGVGELALPWESFFSVFGIIYAILGGFLLIKALERFSALSRAIESEVNALEDVRDYLHYFKPTQAPARRAILACLNAYLAVLRDSEWRLMGACPRERQMLNSDTCPALRNIILAVRDLKTENPMQVAALNGLITRLADITAHRTERIGIACDQLPWSLKVLLGFLSVVLVLSFILMPIGVPAVHLGMVVSITVAASMTYAVISDLDQPFTGMWNVSRKPLLDAEVEFKRETQALGLETERPACAGLSVLHG